MRRLLIALLLFGSIPALAANPAAPAPARGAAHHGAAANVGYRTAVLRAFDRGLAFDAERLQLKPGDRVAVLGAGVHGRILALSLQERGAKVVFHDERLASPHSEERAAVTRLGFEIAPSKAEARARASHVISTYAPVVPPLPPARMAGR